jgi:VWFA-related protein
MAARTTAVLVCALGIALSANQQPSGQRPVFRAGSILVSVDAYPRKDGRVIEGLTKDDFEVFEDGKPQAIETFQFVRVDPVTPDADRRDPTSVADAERQAADPRNRLFVIFLDLFHVSWVGSHQAKAPILDFLHRTLAANDLFAVMTPEVPVSQLTFARRTETFEQELTRYWTWGEDNNNVFPRNDLEGRLLGCDLHGGLVRAHREELSSWTLQQLVIRLGGLRDERKNILLITEGWVPRPGAPPGAGGGTRGNPPTIGVGPGGKLGVGANMSGEADASWCDTQTLRLSQVDYDQRFRDLLDLARRANVSFYPVDLGGLRVGSSGGVNTLRTLAENTDGRAVVNTNDLVAGIRKVTDDLAAHYLLGYYSSNTAADGRFRRIEVKQKRSGETVSARRGYLAPTEEMLKAEANAAARAAAGPTAVDVELGRLARSRPDSRLYLAATASPTTLSVIVELASRELDGGRFKNGAPVTVTITPAKDGAATMTVDGRLEPGSRGTTVTAAIPGVDGDAYRVRAVVTAADEPLRADLDVRVVAPGLVGEAVVSRSASPRAPLRPVADFQFFRSERIHVEWPVFRPLDSRAARLLGRNGAALPLPVALSELADGERIVVTADLTLAPLAAGDYLIELTAGSKDERVTRLIAFRVAR